MNIFLKILFQVRNYLFPAFCAICNCALSTTDELKYSLCDNCRLSINPVKGRTCVICGKPLISEKEACVPCRIPDGNPHENNSHDRLWVLFPYTGRYRKLLTAYKFKKNMALVNFLVEKIINIINENPQLLNAVIIPVPPRPGKIKESGWDQVDYLVKKLKRICKEKRIIFCLKRRKSKIQKQLNRKDRLENLKDRIYIIKKILAASGGKASNESILPETVLIIDDVITTGSTLEVCANVLKNAGVKNVYGLCLFYD